MFGFLRFDFRKAAIIVLVIALPLLSINMKRNPDEDAWYVQPLAMLGGYLQQGFFTFADGVKGTTATYLNLIGIKRENTELKKQNQDLLAQLNQLNEVTAENERLKNLLDFRQSTKMNLLAARVIARDLSPDHFMLRINRGAADGIKKYQGVINTDGVVGYVLGVDQNSARVLAVNDRSSALDAIVQRTRARGLVNGRGSTLARLKYLQRADDVTKGDLIVTSGYRGYFPKGFPIGRVSEVKTTAHGISPEAYLETIVNSARIEELFVVIDSGQEDLNQRFGGGDFGPPLLSKMNSISDTGTEIGNAQSQIKNEGKKP